MIWLAVVLIFLAAFYVAVERGQSRKERVLRWMVMIGAAIMALLIGSGALT